VIKVTTICKYERRQSSLSRCFIYDIRW